MLDEVEDELDRATTNLGIVTQKTQNLIKKSGGKKNFMIILVMSLVVAFLVFLIIYS